MNLKKILFKSPEYYLIVVCLLTGYTPPFGMNPIFGALAVLFALQIVFKHNLWGLIIGVLFFVFNLLFLGALISEFLEFDAFNYSAQKLLFVGLSIWVVNCILSSVMIYKYMNAVRGDNAELHLEHVQE